MGNFGGDFPGLSGLVGFRPREVAEETESRPGGPPDLSVVDEVFPPPEMEPEECGFSVIPAFVVGVFTLEFC